jgi:hypothetical protein
MSAQPIHVVDDEYDDKDPWPKVPPISAPRRYACEQWSAHASAFGTKGLGDAARAPVLTVLTPDHSSGPA